MDTSRNVQPFWSALIRILLYIVAVITPLLLAVVLRPKTGAGLVDEFGKSVALLGFSILAMQFVVGARLKWVERPFGLDMVFRFHKAMGVFAAILLLIHPTLLALGV